MTIRNAENPDCASIAKIYNTYLGKSTMDLQSKSADAYAQFLSQKDNREGLYVGELDGEVIAFGVIKKYSPKKGYQFACETSVFLDQAFVGHGYGSTFKQFIIDECKKYRYNHLVARIFASNKASINYNLKLGYTIVGVQQRIGKVYGRWEDVVVMQYVVE